MGMEGSIEEEFDLSSPSLKELFILACCNGIMLVKPDGEKSDLKILHLVNPLTNQFVILPPPQVESYLPPALIFLPSSSSSVKILSLRFQVVNFDACKMKCVGDDDEHLLLLLLPEEVLIQILVKLPVVSLLRFKSVSKSWCHLIQTSFFIDLHTRGGGGGGGGDTNFILQASRTCENDEYEYDFLVFSCQESSAGYGGGGGGDEVVVFKLDNLENPQLRFYFRYIRPTVMVGSCNGLICLFDSSKLRDVFLWNPATRQSRILPKPSSLTKSDEVFCDVVGFGFDFKTKDYKVLLITYFTPKYIGSGQLEYLCKVEIYTLSTNSWRLLEGINSLPGVSSQERWLYHPGIYLNGCYFFVGCKLSFESYSYENTMIISFDFTKEIFTTMQLPNSDHDNSDDDVVRKRRRRRWYLSCLGDKLALFAIRDYCKYEDCDIWVLNEHGDVGAGVIKESWTKLHFFQIQRSGVRKRTMPRGILNNGEFALLETKVNTNGEKKKKKKKKETKKMQLYNLVTKEAKTDFLVCSRVKTVEVYKPSLVSIFGGNGAAAAVATGVIGGAI